MLVLITTEYKSSITKKEEEEYLICQDKVWCYICICKLGERSKVLTMQTKLTKSMMLSFLVVLLLSVMTVSSPLKELSFQSQVETTNDIMSESETDTLELTLGR